MHSGLNVLCLASNLTDKSLQATVSIRVHRVYLSQSLKGLDC